MIGHDVIGHDFFAVNVIKKDKNSSIQNRTCRTLANLTPHPGCCAFIHEDEEAIETIVKLMNACTDEESQQTYARTLRFVLC